MRKIKKDGYEGILATTKQPVYKQGNRISRKPIYPISLFNLELIDYITITKIGGKQNCY